MAKLQKTITISAPPEKVFAFISQPTNLPTIWPSMKEVRDLSPSPAGGYNFNWTYQMAGMRFEGTTETRETVLNKHILTKTTKGIDSTFNWTFQAEGGGTKLTLDIEYIVPVPLLGKLAEAIIVKQNEKEADALLLNLKAKMEA